MYSLLNLFLKSNIYNKSPKFIARKIFKLFKIFFVETNLQNLPNNNHPTNIDKFEQLQLIEKSKKQFYKPFNTCHFMLEVFSIYESFKKKIKVLDFGANNIDNYLYLNKYLRNWEYIYHDLSHYNNLVKNLIKEKDLKNITVIENSSIIKEPIDFAIFGSSIHYVNNYKEILEKNFFHKSQYIIFSHTPFHDSEYKKNDIVVKQVNISSVINYAYLIYYKGFISFMNKNGYELISENKNNFIKFLNFRNFRNFNFINFLDLIFVYNKKII